MKKIVITGSFVLNIIAALIVIFVLMDRGGWVSRSINVPTRSNYPVTRKVGWKTDVTWQPIALTAKFNHERFNLFNAKSSLNIRAQIKVVNTTAQSTEQIEKIFINQRYIEENGTHIALIELEPQWKSVPHKNRKNDNIYNIVLNEPIENRGWGPNYYRIKMGDYVVNLETQQSK